jgi:hypothetical protein
MRARTQPSARGRSICRCGTLISAIGVHMVSIPSKPEISFQEGTKENESPLYIPFIISGHIIIKSISVVTVEVNPIAIFGGDTNSFCTLVR